MREGLNYKDGQEVKAGDVITYTSATHGPNTTAQVISIGPKAIEYKRYVDGAIWTNRDLAPDAVLRHRAAPVRCNCRTYHCKHGDLHAAQAHRVWSAGTLLGDMRQTVTGKKEQDTMKKAFKAYIIEVDKDGNQVKMLHESIVFAVTKDKAEQAVIIEATTGGVIDANTNFVVVAATLG
jgi:hypothetical protein